MRVKVFLELVEIQAKPASLFPFLLGSFYAWYHYQQINIVNLLLFFLAMFLFNMAVDAHDNYMDYRRAQKTQNIHEKINIIGREGIDPLLVRNLIVILSLIAAVLGVVLVIQVGLPLLWLGMFCFAVGYFYAAGPKPLSHLPVGEIFSGFTMGFMIFFLSVYINVFDLVKLNGSFTLPVFLAALPAVIAIGNLMLVNNTCDLEEDISNHRYTLAYYLGKKNAVRLFKWSYVFAYLWIVVTALIGLFPKMTILTILVFPFIWKNIKLFEAKQVKSETFICGVKNLMMTVAAETIFVFLGLLFHF